MNLFKHLLCAATAFVLVFSLSACSGDDPKENTEKKNDKSSVDSAAEEAREGLVAHSYDGLTFYLSPEFQDEHEGFIFSDGDINVEIESMTLTDVGDWSEYINEDVSSAEDLAQAFEAMENDSDFSTNVQVSEKYGVPYVRYDGAQEASGSVVVIGCYVSGDSAWAIILDTYSSEYVSKDTIQEMIEYATLGIIE